MEEVVIFKERLKILLILLIFFMFITGLLSLMFWLDSLYGWFVKLDHIIMSIPDIAILIVFGCMVLFVIVLFIHWLIVEPYLNWRKTT